MIWSCNSSVLGLQQAGIVEAIVQSVESCPALLHEALYSDICLIGGNTLLPNYRERLERELRTLVPTDFALNVTQAEKYETCNFAPISDTPQSHHSMLARRQPHCWKRPVH